MLASLVILVLGMLGLGWWVSQEIQTSVVQQTATNVALYVSGIVEPNVQELLTGDTITPEHQAILASTMSDTSLGQHITAVKVWDTQGRVIYATDTADIGRSFPIDGDLMHALRGWVAADISNVDKPKTLTTATAASAGWKRIARCGAPAPARLSARSSSIRRWRGWTANWPPRSATVG